MKFGVSDQRKTKEGGGRKEGRKEASKQPTNQPLDWTGDWRLGTGDWGLERSNPTGPQARNT